MILLDTHVLIWWANGDRDRLSIAASQRIDAAVRADDEQQLLVSAMSHWEVAMLVKRGRLALGIDTERWLRLIAEVPAVRLLPLDPMVAMAATAIPEPFHADPADRFLVAQARSLGVPLVSADSKIRDYPHVQSLW